MRALPLLLLLPAAAAAGCSRGEPAPARHVILVTVDTLRADHMSLHGYFRETTPRLDALAARATVFERAYSTSGTTLPSHLSMLTGRLPHEHGYLTNLHAVGRPFRTGGGLTTLAEVLGGAGYETAAFVSAAPVGRRTGVQAGFAVFDDPEGRRESRTADETNAKLFPWLRSWAAGRGEQPLFLWVHYWDVHEPNVPPEPYASLFPADDGVRQVIQHRGVRPDVLAASFPPRILARHFDPARFADWSARDAAPAVDMDGLADLYGRYDGDVRYVDDRMGDLVDLLAELGLWDDALFVFTADHGQGLGEHDWLEHGRIFDACVRVPLVVRAPDRPGERVSRVVSLVDLMPAVLGELGLGAPGSLLAGGPALAFHQRSDRGRKQWEEGEHFAVTTERWKLVRRAGGGDELFDLTRDGERVSVLDEHPDVAAELAARLEELLARPPAEVQAAEGDDGVLAEQLDELGYGGDDDGQ